MTDYGEGMKLLHEYAELLNKKDALERDLAVVKSKMNEIENVGVDFMLEKELQNLTINGRVLFLRENRFAEKIAEKEVVVETLKKVPEFRDLVNDNYNANSLNARVKEYYDLNGRLPDEFDNVISIGTQHKMGSRKAA